MDLIKRSVKSGWPWLIALLLSLLFFCIPALPRWIVQQPGFSASAANDARVIGKALQNAFFHPWGTGLSRSTQYVLIFPYLLLWMFIFRAIYLYTRRFWKWFFVSVAVALLVLFIFPDILLVFDSNQPSRIFGQVHNGRIENTRRIPMRGDNYTTYSFLCYLSGRTHVHEGVRDIVVESYRLAADRCGNHTFVLGETGWRNGGRFLPHRTHRNGLSVDFMSPLLRNGQPYRSSHIFNTWGYGRDFELDGSSGELEIDYEAMACHILAVVEAAEAQNWSIAKIIFDPLMQPDLFATSSGAKLRGLPFTKNRVVIRHDDHYHIDFRKR